MKKCKYSRQYFCLDKGDGWFKYAYVVGQVLERHDKRHDNIRFAICGFVYNEDKPMYGNFISFRIMDTIRLDTFYKHAKLTSRDTFLKSLDDLKERHNTSLYTREDFLDALKYYEEM